jgi:hypothetical protein
MDDWRDEQAENEACDALLERLAQRRFLIEAESSAMDDGLVYKAVMNPPSRETATMDDESSRQWTAWAKRVAREEFAKMEADLIADLDAYHDVLQTKIDALSARITQLQMELAAASADNKSASSSVIALRGRV